MAWVQNGWGIQIDSVDQLMRAIARIGTLQAGERFVWRGVSNARHAIQSSLQRALAKNRDYYVQNTDSGGAISDLEAAERRIIRAAREWKLGFEGGVYLDDLHLLASLQHHGVPTRLLDVTEDPMTALWFACQKDAPKRDTSAVLFAFNVTRLMTVGTIDPPNGTWGHIEDPLGASLRQAISKSEETHQPLLVEPTIRDTRMIAQQGLFMIGAIPKIPIIEDLQAFEYAPRHQAPGRESLLNLLAPEERGRGRPGLLDFCAVVIPTRVKSKMLRHLACTYSKTYPGVYPDIEGFAAAIKDREYPLS